MSLPHRLGGLRPKPIIATEISYGLGNQMFQYAIGRRLAHATNGKLILLFNKKYTKEYSRSFGLNHFNIAGSFVRDVPVDPGDPHTPQIRARLTGRIAWAARRLQPLPIIRERVVWDLMAKSGPPEQGAANETLFMPDLLEWRGGIHLIGYWQNERYFMAISDLIRKDFSLKKSLDERNLALLARIQSGPSAFIHVRRGDYLLPSHINLHGVCGKEYYDTATARLRQLVGSDLRFFVFSDDPAWVRETKIGGDFAEIIDWNGTAPERDLALMMACQHAIIANSSFSWWGAWLGEKPGQIVIAPRAWYKAMPQYQDIFPQRWLRL